jgi:hypothetical protein
VRTPGLAVKDAGFLSCSQYDRSDPAWKHPAACDWFDSPSRPTGAGGTSSGPLDLSAGRTAPATGGPELLTLGIGVLVLGGLAAGRRGRRPASGKR